ncbi:diacylglycerol/lipid kinase family protein [Amycolatopsis sp.]|uniref:diacylglycerol/lipid kinase family protein n=1 Tax=Amycolatopsis sp. TaxID=37632 RepID=UPI002C23E78C|nr:diacylglycerol kinase family protein [Amycolatopsis sp.]HVV14545.1 diacylglycerol kinase family protein [Amycolatopsis sp.]
MATDARPSPARRLCAALSLLAVLVALGIGIGALVRHPVQLVIAVVLIVCAVNAAWFALVHHGVRRWSAALAALLALAGLVALPGLHAIVVLLVVLGLCVLAMVTARIAFGHDLAPERTGVRVGRARRGVLLVNPRSGGGKAERFGLLPLARERGVVAMVLQPGDDLRALAEGAVAAGADVLGMAGGDGSQALVADVARRHGVAFVCVPAGTRNHFALDLGLDREDVPAALDAFGPAFERRVDLAMVGDRVFVNNASLGVYAAVVQSPGYRDAKLATVAQRLPELLGPDAERPDLRFTRPEHGQQPPADILLISNGAYRLDHVNGFGTRERLDAGRLGIVAVTVDRARDVPALISAELAGKLSEFHGYREWTANEFVVDSASASVEVGVDGEALRLPPPLRFSILPGALRVRVPVDAPQAAPAALVPHGITGAIGSLFLVLSGRPAHREPG